MEINYFGDRLIDSFLLAGKTGISEVSKFNLIVPINTK